MSLKRLAVLAVLCLELLFCSTHEAQAQAGSDYASTAYADLSDGYSHAYCVYYNPAYPATANNSFISSVGRCGPAGGEDRLADPPSCDDWREADCGRRAPMAPP
jgi:hypothetical protein